MCGEQEGGGVRVYLPPDANTLLSVTDHCLRSRNYVNVIVAGKQPAPQWLDMDAAIKHCTAGIGIWEWASNDQGSEPDVVMACCGDVPTLETLAAVDLLRRHFPELESPGDQRRRSHETPAAKRASARPERQRIRCALHDRQTDHLRLPRLSVLIHRLTYRRTNHKNMHVRGFKEEGTTSTPFDMVVMNDLDRFHLVADVIDRVPLARSARGLRQASPARQSLSSTSNTSSGIAWPIRTTRTCWRCHIFW
jgi:xylulose-5-phosphate/fructose-6-phosphate phosphoketolase